MAVYVKKQSEFAALGLDADARTFSSNDFELTEVLACREERVAQPHSSECDANGCDQRAGFKFENKEESFWNLKPVSEFDRWIEASLLIEEVDTPEHIEILDLAKF